ncbi:MAG: hypothetical protein QOE23_3078 [Pseudonocardiales bacterium]|jgi:hypothetical protein|nr:hypothetical protein [Pseudonocardiales bacterium]
MTQPSVRLDPVEHADGLPAHQPVAFHALSYLDDGGEVTVGRMDVGEFVVLPDEGAQLLRRLEEGMTPVAAAEWFLETYGEPIDVLDFVRDLDDLGFVRHQGEAGADLGRVRWQRLGRMIFSPAGAVAYGLLMLAWIVAMVREPILIPHNHNLFFTHYLTVLLLALFFGQLPLILLHESAHALAGRRLGLPSKLSIGRRLYFVVFQTTMNGLMAMPRRKRFLPIMAGMLTDLAALAALTLFAGAMRRGDGSFPPLAAFALTLAYVTMLRLVWQCWFFLETDIYYVIVTVLGCVNLQVTSKQVLRNFFDRRLGRPRSHDPASWHPRDLRVARWYAVLIAAGYGFLLITLCAGFFPAMYQILRTEIGHLTSNHHDGTVGLLDGLVFLLLAGGQLALAAWLFWRGRRQQAPAIPSR